MTIQEVAQRLWPAWAMGLVMVYLVMNSTYAKLLRIDKKGLVKFAKWMIFITLLRIIVIKYLSPKEVSAEAHEMANFLPWQVTLWVFWEDMCHTVPLVLMGKFFGKEKWYRWVSYPLLAIIMLSFGSGHVYQGIMSAAFISLYIPFTIRLAKKYGFGTIMLCHMLYDLVTILTFKWMIG